MRDNNKKIEELHLEDLTISQLESLLPAYREDVDQVIQNRIRELELLESIRDNQKRLQKKLGLFN
ncbi:MAG: hypothetical protein ACOC2W_01440 [bacterium]